MAIAAPRSIRHPHLYDHQHKAHAMAIMRESFALFLDTGTGKTATMLAMLGDLKARFVCGREDFKALVVAPLAILRPAWAEDARKFAPNLSVSIVAGKPEDRKRAMKARADIYITNFDAYRIEYDDLVAMNFDALVIDESSKIKNPKSIITKKVIRHSRAVKHRFVMSGTPTPNSILEIYPQIEVVAPGLLGANYYAFRARYGYSHGYGHYQWTVSAANKALITEIIKPWSYSVNKNDCLDLPDQVHAVKLIEWKPRQKKIYDAMRRDFIAEIENRQIVAQAAITQIMKLRQITSGFLLDEKHGVNDIETNKYDALIETLEEIGDHQVIIWCHFHAEIKKVLAAIGDSATAYYGETPNGERDEILERFKSGQTRYLVSHPASLGHGVTLTNAQYAIYFSLSHSYEFLKQSQDRIYRIGTKSKVQYFYLQVEDSIDEAIWKAVKNKERWSETILAEMKK